MPPPCAYQWLLSIGVLHISTWCHPAQVLMLAYLLVVRPYVEWQQQGLEVAAHLLHALHMLVSMTLMVGQVQDSVEAALNWTMTGGLPLGCLTVGGRAEYLHTPTHQQHTNHDGPQWRPDLVPSGWFPLVQHIGGKTSADRHTKTSYRCLQVFLRLPWLSLFCSKSAVCGCWPVLHGKLCSSGANGHRTLVCLLRW